MQPPASSEATKTCPYCGQTILAIARKCRFCREYLDAEDRPPSRSPGAADRWLLPIGRPGSAIAAGYLGLLALFPVVGVICGVAAVVMGVIALRKLKRHPELVGRGRAIFGLIAGTLSVVVHVVVVVAILVSARHPGR